MPKRTTRTIPPTILRVTELERRDTPAWWSVAAPVPAEGTAGVTDATHAGSLVFRPELAATNGTATVWADTAALAVAKALAGTITVTLPGQTVAHAFGPATVGATAADHKAFLAVVSGASVSLAFEDMAGQPGCDYDYNDRSWNDLPTPNSSNPIVFEGDFNWTGLSGGVTIHEKVEAIDESTYRWNFALHNDTFFVPWGYGSGGWGVGSVKLPAPGNPQDVTASGSDGGGPGEFQGAPGGGAGMVRFQFSDGMQHPGIMPGGGASMWYETAPRPLADGDGYAWNYPVNYFAGGGVKGPGKATADITIDGDLTVGATDPNIPGSKPVVTEFSPKNDTNEDTIGGLVVRNPNNIADNNVVPRQQITIQKLKDAAGNPAVGGQVTLTVPGQVKLFDAAAGGNPVPTGTVFDYKALPKTLWVEGAIGSTLMRDAKIKAEPAGNPAGADDVSFTVLWVDVVVATSGYISTDNDKRDNYENWTELGTSKLGLQQYNNYNKYGARMGWGTEARGAVSPGDFNYPGADLTLDRDREGKGYENGQLFASVSFSQTIPVGNDGGDLSARDSNPIDSKGFIYAFDAPGLWLTPKANGTVLRTRQNFRAFASVTIGGSAVRPSGIYSYFVRFSMRQNGMGVSGQWTIINPPDIQGDMQANGPNCVSKLSANLN